MEWCRTVGERNEVATEKHPMGDTIGAGGSFSLWYDGDTDTSIQKEKEARMDENKVTLQQ